jgi:6-phosphofructokinase 1
MSPRIPSGFDDPIISERLFLNDLLNRNKSFPEVTRLGNGEFPNHCDQRNVGKFRDPNDKRVVTTDWNIMERYKKPELPRFLVAGPRRHLAFDPKTVQAAVVTTGGSAPGLNCVIHSIVKRHHATYELPRTLPIKGVHDSFRGMCNLQGYMRPLNDTKTEQWLERGGSMLGMRRYHDFARTELAQRVVQELYNHKIDILYVIGGGGSLSTAHEIANVAIRKSKQRGGRRICVVGIPKTMDNDVMWVSESFGFKTAVEKATDIINTLNAEAETSRRLCLIELFGAESGYVAAHSALASGHVDLALVPEDFLGLSTAQCQDALNKYLAYLIDKVTRMRPDEKPHAIVVLAEGAAKILRKKRVKIGTQPVSDDNERGFLIQLKQYLKKKS